MTRRIAACIALAALLASCSALRLTYNNADTLIRFAAHEYFDLDEAQNEQFRRRLAQYHEWHRSVELPQYAELMRKTARTAGRGASREDIKDAAEAVRNRYRALIARAAEDAGPVLVTLAPGQIEELEKKLARNNHTFADEFLSGSGQHRARLKRLLGRFRDWTGELSDEQEARIERLVRDHAPLAAMRFDDRRRWQREAVALIRSQRDAKALGAALAAAIGNPEKGRGPEVSAAFARWEADMVDLVRDIERMLSAEQRAHVVKTMERYAQEFETLAGERAAVRAAANP